MVKNVSEVMLTSLPNFWRIARGFLEGKLKKVGPPQNAPTVTDFPRRVRTPAAAHGAAPRSAARWL